MAPKDNEQFLNPPQSWHDRLRMLGGESIGKGAFVTNAELIQGLSNKFSLLSIPKGEKQFGLSSGIYIVTDVTVEEVVEGRFARENLFFMGSQIQKMVLDPHDKKPKTVAPIPDEIREQGDFPLNAEMSLGDNMILNMLEQTMNGCLVFEVLQTNVSDVQQRFGLRGDSNSDPRYRNN